jgi:leader peptidase (prepilin peptidase)/N-methyltransferase
MIGFVLGLLAMYFQDWSWAALPLCLGIGLLPAIAIVDLHFGIIPDEHNLLLGVLGVLFIWTNDGDLYLATAVAAALLCVGLFFALVYSKWRGREMLGLGDVKFFAASGFWLHPHSSPWFLAAGGLIGVSFNFWWQRVSKDKQFPFAPALCAALVLCILYQLTGSP